MTINVGHDTAKTRKTLSINGKSISFYSIPAAENAGLGEEIEGLIRAKLLDQPDAENSETEEVAELS